MKDFTGKVAFITGGASGAGFGQAKVFSEAGCKVVIADIRQDHLDEAKAYFGEKKVKIHAIKLDITDRQAYTEAADEVEKIFGCPPQLLIQTAGVNTFGPAEASTFEDFDWVLGVNLMGVINGMVTFVPRMIKAGKGGHIAATSSMAGFAASHRCTPYSVAKAGLNSLMEAYYVSLKPYGIGVSCLCPGGIKSNIAEATFTRPKHLENTGYNVDDKVIDFMRYHYSTGIDPVELALILKKGIEDEVFFVLPFSEPEKVLREHMERIFNYTTLEGTKKQEVLNKQKEEERAKNPNKALEGAAEAGWAKARADITWAKDRANK